MRKELLETYEYFSHNFRTCTSTIVATIEALKMELISINDDEMNSVYESAYILDVLDISLNICIEFLIQKEIKITDYELNLMNLVRRFLDEQKGLVLLNELSVDVDGEDVTIIKNGYIIKYFLQLILFEAIKNAKDHLSIFISPDRIRIVLGDNKDEPPVIFSFLATIFKHYGNNFTFSSKEYLLEFKS